jgi:transglutaminase-like putative cysteine protease
LRETTEQSLTPGLQLQLYLLTGLVLLPHAANLPLPVSLFLFALLGWRLISLRLPRLLPGRWLLIPVTLASVLLIYSQHQTLLGRDAGVSLLSVMLVLKTLEVRKRRDLTVTVYIAYFVIVTQFLFNQSFLLLLYLLLALIGHTALLLAIQRVTPARNYFEPYQRTFWLALQALPIALILFVLFPRLTHPLWHFGYDASAITGLSERVRPGTISQLIQSSEIAFRVSFSRTPPPPEERYWRALVLWDTDGVSWFTRKDPPLSETMPRLIPQAEAVEYKVFLEPHRQRWLYALDLPAIAQAGATLTPDFLLRAERPVTRPLQYQGLSFIKNRIESTPPEQLQRALKLGDGITPRQRQLVRSWLADSADAETVVQRSLDFFHQNPFVYTLNPPTYLDNPVEQFLFEEREGFCEHYASAFTQLMRLAGIPARMVVGFQGGEYNRLGDYYTIRHYDAHAWSEVWLAQQGWVRVDPTAAVAPERVRNAIQPEFGSVGDPARFMGMQAGVINSALRDLGMLLDTAEVNWREWVLGFSRDQQFGLMRGLGMQFLRAGGWGILSVGLITAVLALIGLRLVLQGRVKTSQEVRLYRLFCRRMANIGLPRAAHEGPLDYSIRISRQRPDLAPQIQAISRLYIGLRYGARQTRPQRNALTTRVRSFRPRRINRAE